MKKIILLIAVLFLGGQFIKAQNERRYIGINIGPSFPSSDFAKTDINDSTSGYAKTGIDLRMVYAFRLSHNLGFQFNINYHSNEINIQKLEASAIQKFKNMSFSIENRNPWTGGCAFFGPYFRFPITRNLSWDVRGSIGLYVLYSPDFIIRGTSVTGDKAEYYRYTDKSFSFGYTIGTGLKYRINNYYILLFADYSGTDTQFNHVTGTGWDNTPYDIPLKQSIRNLSVTVGFAYIL